MKRIGIVGSRRKNHLEYYDAVYRQFFSIYEKGDWIVSGGCPTGGDRFARVIQKAYSISYLEFPANWHEDGKAAGFIRNTEIAKWSDVLIACVSDDRTGGTEDTIKKAKAMKKEVIIIA